MNIPGDPPYESRLEIRLDGPNNNLFHQDSSFFERLVDSAGVKIISHRKFSDIQMSILSESSLIVSRDRLVIVTCGNARILECARFLQSQPGLNHWHSVCLELRHSPDMPNQEKISAPDIFIELGELIEAPGIIWHNKYSACFSYSRNAAQLDKPRRLRVMIGEHEARYGPKEFKDLVVSLEFPIENIDDHIFSPPGYSLNCARVGAHLTLHYTPARYLSIDAEGLDELQVNILKRYVSENFPNSCLSILG